jgi:alanyl-tRNA synthetase
LYTSAMSTQNLTVNQIRSKFLTFMESKGHVIVPSASLVPENDPTTLFTGSGMQPMVPYLLGQPHPLGKRITDSQKSFRSQDIEEVGDNRHTTFFEMLGNWSFGDYFKEEEIRWMFDFLIEELALDPHHLYVTCFSGNESLGVPRDTFSAELWQRLFAAKDIDALISETPEAGMKAGERIFYYNEKKNWWSRMGVPANMGEGEPGGPDSEMFYDFDPTLLKKVHETSSFAGEPCHVNCDCGRFLEIGNNVFMQYKKTATGFQELPQMNVWS